MKSESIIFVAGRTAAAALTLAMLISCLSACGPGRPGTDAAYQRGTDLCSEGFAADYNAIINKASTVSTMSDLQALESMVDRFGTRYRDVNCKAEVYDRETFSSTVQTVDVNSRVSDWKRRIAAFMETADSDV